MTVRLRDAAQGDSARLAALERELFGADAWSEQLLAEEVAGAHGTVVVAEADAGIVGYAAVRGSGDVVDLTRIAVVAQARRTGLATRLLDEVRRAAHARGATAMLLEVSAANEAACAFYAARGFTQIDLRPGYYRDGSDALVMREELT